MTICHNCAAPTPDHTSRGPLSVQLYPPRGYWKGKEPFELKPCWAKLMQLFIKCPEVSALALDMILAGERADGNTSHVQLAHLRKRLPKQVRIITIRDATKAGRPASRYQLEIDDD